MSEQKRLAEALVKALDRYEQFHDEELDRRCLLAIHTPKDGPSPITDDIYLRNRELARSFSDGRLPRDGQELWDLFRHLTWEPPDEEPLYKSVFATLRKFRTWLVNSFLTDRPHWDGKKLWYGDTLCCELDAKAHVLGAILAAC